MPTRFTRVAGLALVISSVLWLIGVGFLYAAEVADRTRRWKGLPTYFLLGAFTLLAAGALLAVGILGIIRRHGGALGNLGRAAFWIAVITAFTAFGTWAWGFWLTALGIGAVVLAVALQRSDIAPRIPGYLVGIDGHVERAHPGLFDKTATTRGTKPNPACAASPPPRASRRHPRP